MPKPICVHCGSPYGRRTTTTETVRWDAPHRQTEHRQHKHSVHGFVQVGDIPPPPPYQGNGIVVRESRAYVSADDGRAVMERYIWDGQSWHGGYSPFCTLRCALDYARKAYARASDQTLRRVK